MRLIAVEDENRICPIQSVFEFLPGPRSVSFPFWASIYSLQLPEREKNIYLEMDDSMKEIFISIKV